MIFTPCTDDVRLGLGGAPLGNLFTVIDDDAALDLLRSAWDTGCRTFDNALHCGNGRSEHRMGQVLRNMPRYAFVLSTKVGRPLIPDAAAPRDQNGNVSVLPFRQVWDYSAAGVRRSIEESLQRLGMALIDVAYIHDCDAAAHGAHYPRFLHQVVNETVMIGAQACAHWHNARTMALQPIPTALWNELRARGLVPGFTPTP